MASRRPTQTLRRLELSVLSAGFKHLSPVRGAQMAEAAAVSLEDRDHKPGVSLRSDGAYNEVFEVAWNPIDSVARESWNDLDEAAEHGAYGLAILMIRSLTGYSILERSRKGTGFDWWLGKEDSLFQDKARLEVSGIRSGGESRLTARTRLKEKQTTRSDRLGLKAFVVVIEFSTPRARVVKR